MFSRIKFHIKFYLAFLLFPFHYSIAQSNGGLFYHLTTAEGLSSNRVNDIIQDREGFYWIATEDGLNRFDGSVCKIYRNIKNDSTSLSHNNCTYLVEDDEGDIWVGTLVGLSRFSKKEGKFEQFFFHNPHYSFDKTNWIKGLTKDKNGNIWVCAAGLRMYNISTRSWKNYVHDPKDPESIPSDLIDDIRYDRHHHGIWIISNLGFVYLNLALNQFYSSVNNPKNLSIFSMNESDGIYALDTMDNLWVHHSSYNELWKYSLSSNKLEKVIALKYAGGLRNLSVDKMNRIWIHFWIGKSTIYNSETRTMDTSFLAYSHSQSALTPYTQGLYVDKMNNYWIYSNKGISIFNPYGQAVQYYLLEIEDVFKRSLKPNIACIAEQNDSLLWIGTSVGLFQYNTYNKKTTSVINVKTDDNFVCSVFLQNDSILWVGGNHELILYDIRKKLILKKYVLSHRIEMIKEDKDKNVWAATWSIGLLKFTKDGMHYRQFLQGDDSLRSPACNNLICFSMGADDNDAWIGYNGGNGFSGFDLNNEMFHHFIITGVNQATSNTVNCIVEDGNKNLWIGTFGGGLIFYNRNKKNYTSYTQADGLKGEFINGIVNDGHSNLWVFTTNGISIIDLNSHAIISSEIEMAQPSNDFYPDGLLRKNGKMLFYSENKIAEIEPVLFLQSTFPSKMVYSGFKVFDKEIGLRKSEDGKFKIRLPHNKNFFSIEYSLLRSNPQAIVKYGYMLKGFDRDWNYTGEKHIANYTNVPPGHYLFYAQASDITGKWKYFSEPLAIIITPPFWKTWWFILITVALLIFGLYSLYRYRIGQLKKVMTIRTKISQDLHDEIASTLSGIRLYSELAKQQLEQSSAGKAMESLEIISTNASEMKEGISDIVWAVNPSNDSFKTMMEKLKLYASGITKAAGISFEFGMQESIPDEKLDMPQRRNIYMICKEAINNSVKYARAEKLTMRIQQQEHTIIINIQDNGIGFDTQNVSLGNGLFNIKQRAEEIGAKVSIQSAPVIGSNIELKIKL